MGNDDHDPTAHDLLGRRAEPGQGRTIVVASLGHATMIAMKAASPHVVLCFIPPHSTSNLQPCDEAVFRSFKSCTKAQASATLARSVLDGSFDDVVTIKAWRRQSSAEWAARAVTDFCDKNQVWDTGWRQLRARSDDDFREAVHQANTTGDLFAKQIEPEPAPEDPVEWATAEASDDEDEVPMPDAPAPREPELIGMPPALASAPPISNLERYCAWCTALDSVEAEQIATCSISQRLSVVSRVGCPVSPVHARVSSLLLRNSDPGV